MKIIILSLLIGFFFIACETGLVSDKNTSNTTKQNSEIAALIGEDIYMEDEGFDTDLHPIILDEPEESIPVTDTTAQEFEGGLRSDGLNVKTIREGNHDSYMRLVFDTYTSSKGSSEPSLRVGHYKARYDSSKQIITVTIEGYKSFSAPFPDFSSQSIVEKIYFDKHLDENAYTFYIQLRNAAKVRVFELKNPARLVFDIKKL